MNSSSEIDASWDRALEVIQGSLSPNSGLARLTRLAWNTPISNRDFASIFGLTGLSTTPIIRAAQYFDPSLDTLDRALSYMGARMTAFVASVHFSTQEVLHSPRPDRVLDAAIKHLMNHIETGYHLGMTSDAIGPEVGMLIGFSQAIGTSILASRVPRDFDDPNSLLNLKASPQLFLTTFGCEPHQVSSLALQRLGYGSELASNAAVAFGRSPIASREGSSDLALWRAGADWISAFLYGQKQPASSRSLALFPELLPPTNDQECSVHLSMLYQQIDEICTKSSTWSWHLATPVAEEVREVIDPRSESIPGAL